MTSRLESDVRANSLKNLEASDLAVTIRGWDSDPILDISFDHPARPGLRLVRRELLRTEFGFAQYQSDMGIFLDVDVETEFFPPFEWAQNGTLYV